MFKSSEAKNLQSVAFHLIDRFMTRVYMKLIACVNSKANAQN